jgi:hypothetical protein
MLKQTFESQPFLYPVAAGPGAYHPELTTPPRIYSEEFYHFPIIFLNQEQLLDGYEVIYLFVTVSWINFPGYAYVCFRFNATTGAFLNQINGLFSAFNSFAQSRDGTVWNVPHAPLTDPYHAFKCTIDPVLGVTVDAAPTYDLTILEGGIAFNAFCIESATGLILIAGSAAELRVHQISSGALLRAIPTPGVVVQIMPEDSDRCYVYCDGGQICLINYTLGTLISVFQIQSGAPSGDVAISWDTKYRRFLYWTNDSPLAVDGQNTTTIKGYFPMPLIGSGAGGAGGLMMPVPLRPLRRYKTVPVLTRVYDDMAQPIGGGLITFTADPAIVKFEGYPSLTDSDGEAIGQMTDLDSGSVVVTATIDAGDGGAITPPVVIPSVVGTPNFIPATGATFATTESVSIGTTTLGAAIYYTSDGSTPTSGSTLYVGPLTLSASTTLKAIAILSGFTDSNVATATYTLTSLTPVAPDAPTSPVLTAGDGEVSLDYVAGFDGGAPVLHSNAITNTGHTGSSTSGSPILITGTPNGTPVTATVTQTNSAGTSLASVASNSVTPVAAGGGGGGSGPFATSLRVILQGQTVPNSTGSTPPAPTNGNYQKLSWAAVAGATLYKVYRTAANGVTFPPTPYGTSTTNSFADTAATGCVSGVVGPSGPGLANYVANRYLYQVTAVVGGVESAPSATQSYDHFTNGVLFGIGGTFNSGVSENDNCTVAPMSGSAKFIRITQTGSFGFYLPYSGNNFSQWNEYLAGVNYFDFWCRCSAGVSLGLGFHRAGDVLIYNSSGGAKSVDLSSYATFVANTWIHYKIPIADILGDYSASGAGPMVIQRAFYKYLFQDHNNTFGTWDFDNGLWTP